VRRAAESCVYTQVHAFFRNNRFRTLEGVRRAVRADRMYTWRFLAISVTLLGMGPADFDQSVGMQAPNFCLIASKPGKLAMSLAKWTA
jgi:hypothetical protein